MQSNHFLDPEHSSVKSTRRTTATPATTLLKTKTSSMFNNAQNPYITGGSFSITTKNTNFNTANGTQPLDTMYKRAAPHAILNAGGRADEVRCHPGTRQEVLQLIEKWRDAQDTLTPPIFWLSGPAGAGKTAIVQTIAERCKAQGVSQANFFFFRTDPTRNSLSPFVATLLHQIILLYPHLRDHLAAVISDNPLIFDSAIKDQLEQLIILPLLDTLLSSSSSAPPLLLILDGLDECESENKRNQRQILDAFDKVFAEHRPFLFRLLVASRDESQIRGAFNSMSSQLLPLYLDNKYSPENDIRAFVIDEFKRIHKVHPLAHTLDAIWPSAQDVDDIVSKSSGQFIYAATVMRFVADSPASPALSLARVKGAAQLSTKSPFSRLDAIYTYILSQVDDQEALKDILHAHFLIQDMSQTKYVKNANFARVRLTQLLGAYRPQYTHALVHSCLSELTPILQYTHNRASQQEDEATLLFHHASFPDYLMDRSRSGNYFVDFNAFNSKIQPAVWKGLEIAEESLLTCRQTFAFIAYPGLLRLRQLPPDFMKALISLDTSLLHVLATDVVKVSDIFKCIYNLCTSEQEMTDYKRLLRQWSHTLDYIPPPQVIYDYAWPPCARRYLAMATIEHDITTDPFGDLSIALRPEAGADTRETVLWLKKILHRIHREKYHNSLQEYNHLIQKWTSWTTWNDIRLEGVDDLPNIWWYIYRSSVEKWVASRLGLASSAL